MKEYERIFFELISALMRDIEAGGIVIDSEEVAIAEKMGTMVRKYE